MNVSRQSMPLLLGLLMLFGATLILPHVGVADSLAPGNLPFGGGDTPITGTAEDLAWFYGVTHNPISDLRTEFSLLINECPIADATIQQLADEITPITGFSAQEKLIAAMSGIFDPLHPDGKKPASCVQSAICFCELISKILPSVTCEIKGGASTGGGDAGVLHAFNKLSGMPGFQTVYVDSLNSLAFGSKK